MKETRYYQVAEHAFSVTGEESIFALMGNYEPFCVGSNQIVFSLTITDDKAPVYIEELRQNDEGQTIICGRTADGHPVYEYRWQNKMVGWLICSNDYSEGRLVIVGPQAKMVLNNALMMLYSLSTADKGTMLFHSAVVSYCGKGYMFLGKSGTGKSTHAALWLRYITGSELMNDDNPVVRVMNGKCFVYGSPWSGKTPCYRNVSCELGGIVQLSQAPYNKIRRLIGVESYAVLMPSISGKRWDKRVADGLHQSENTLAKTVPTWYLECLPDEAAALLCKEKICDDR
ncbi:hypothetical protein SAMN05216354_2384 [Xylanibacter ruminicola]|uniref:Phosphoenolpyruvate carboxykinase n=1 Tax=Xylanibacter ruminicola TaxID=839 RepID=A0A1H5WJS9_XYLRU|nr:hypothetical protein [Xylanibacter ruminicola]SEF99548.1 hypothetical protein SAMN05216354_2384 [Xylanibacter ruminicola]